MANIRKRVRDGKVDWQVRYRTAEGFRYKSFATRKLADYWIRTELNQALQETSKEEKASSITVAKALDSWIDTVASVGRHGREPVSPDTVRKYRERSQNHIKPLIGHLAVAEFTAAEGLAFRKAILERCARATAKKCLTDLKGAFAEARVRGEMGTDPLADIKIVDSARRSRRPEIPTRAQMRELERCALLRRDHPDRRVSDDWARFYAIFLTLRWTGMRPAEMRALEDRSVLYERGQLRVLQGADESGTIGPVKTHSGYRAVQVPLVLLEALSDWQMIREAARGWKEDAEGLLFPTSTGRPISLANITNRLWYPLLEDAGFPKRFDLYSLRHFRISERLAAGEDIHTVSQEAGHADAGFTLRTYGHVMKEGLD